MPKIPALNTGIDHDLDRAIPLDHESASCLYIVHISHMVAVWSHYEALYLRGDPFSLSTTIPDTSTLAQGTPTTHFVFVYLHKFNL